jgi:hypothetical protein
MRIRVLLSIFLLVPALFAGTATSQTSADLTDLSQYPVRFAIIGDRTGEHQEGVYGQVLEEIQRLRPEFIITVGDMIEGYTSDTTQLNEEWTGYFNLVKSLNCPIYFTPGNHDITFDDMEPMYERYVGKPYHSFDYRGVHIVVMDNSRWEVTAEWPKEQIDWVTEDLKEHQNAAATLVFMHKPFWYNTLGDNKPDFLHDIFVKYGVDAVFNGHMHQYFSAEYDGILYSSIGSSGGDTEPTPTGLWYHFGWVTVDGDGVHAVPIEKGGVRPWNDMSADQMRTLYTLDNHGLRFEQPVPINGDLAVDHALVRLVVDNSIGPVEARDTLRWDIPDGWTVEPAEQEFVVPAGGTGIVDFTVTGTGPLFPLPSVEAHLPYTHEHVANVDQTLEASRQVNCLHATSAPVIDGDLSDACWQGQPVQLIGPDGGKREIDSTAVYFAYDGNNLYYAAYCQDEHMDSLLAKMTERDDDVYGEDCFGVMVHPADNPKLAYQIYINPLGTVYDQKLYPGSDWYWTSDNTYNLNLDVKTTKGPDYWTVEVRLPLDQLGATPSNGDHWRIQFRRKQPRFGDWAGLQPPWSYNPSTYGELIFE